MKMLTGTPPFTGSSAFSVAFQHVHNEAPTLRSRRPDLPDGLSRLIERLLAKDPDRRPATAGEVRDELLLYADPAAAVVKRRRMPARIGIATVATLAVPAVVLSAWPQTRTPPATTAVSTPSPSASPLIAVPSLAAPTRTPASPVPQPAVRSPQPRPSAPSTPGPPSVQDQIADLRTYVVGLRNAGEVPPKNADELTHLLDDLARLVTQGKQREADDKLAAIRKKNDDLFHGGKLSPAGHTTIAERLDRLAATM
jgi:serine/threonine protein kinase